MQRNALLALYALNILYRFGNPIVGRAIDPRNRATPTDTQRVLSRLKTAGYLTSETGGDGGYSLVPEMLDTPVYALLETLAPRDMKVPAMTGLATTHEVVDKLLYSMPVKQLILELPDTLPDNELVCDMPLQVPTRTRIPYEIGFFDAGSGLQAVSAVVLAPTIYGCLALAHEQAPAGAEIGDVVEVEYPMGLPTEGTPDDAS